MVVGLPGVIVALVVRLTLREPPRGFSDPGREIAPGPGVMLTTMKLLRNPVFLHMSFAASLHAFMAYGVGGFTPAFLQRSHGLSTQSVGTWMALITAGGGIVGTFLGGYLSERGMKSSGDQRFLLWIPAVSTLLNVPFQVLSLVIWAKLDLPWIGATPVILLLLIPTWLVGTMYLGPTFALTQTLVSIRERAVSGAVLLFIINLIGLGAGPWLTGIISDAIRAFMLSSGVTDASATAEGLRYSLLIMTCFNIWSAIHYFVAAKHMHSQQSHLPSATVDA